ncbi:hypothetical protein F4779DRAFT_615486 [Xylariaceae sp. FL0662B]|nr:hypothetical protein F4779DRAFT_615486 [Xylariaceae sp. FL0662B]
MALRAALVALLAPFVVAQQYSESASIVTQSVTETVYVSQCSAVPTPAAVSDITVSGTITLTSTLQSTVSVTVSSGATNTSGSEATGYDGFSQTLLTTLSSTLNFSSPVSPTLFTNLTKTPCSTQTVVVTPPYSTGVSSTLSTNPSASASTGTSATASAHVSPTQVPINESATVWGGAGMQALLGALGVVFMLVAGFL